MENRHSNVFKGVFPESTEKIVDRSWETQLSSLVEKGLLSYGNKPLEEVRVMMRMVDDLIRTRILEAFERVGMEGRSLRTRRRINEDIQRQLKDPP